MSIAFILTPQTTGNKEPRQREWEKMSLLSLVTLQAVSSLGRTLTGGERQIRVVPHREQAWVVQGLSAAAFVWVWKGALRALRSIMAM